jgi:catechol 2,3-dioxygenase-like lactoylglutathione lyase family enzyme
MPAPRVSGVMETSLYVADLDAAQAFYQRLFGFELFLAEDRMRALGVPGGQVLLLFRHGGSVTPSPAPGGMIPPHDARGQQHVCFAIPWMALGDWERHLAEQGVAVESRIHWPGRGTSLYFRDPDGHSVEVATPGLWPNL